MNKKPKLLFFVAEDWYFCSHRLPLAVSAQSSGYDVSVVTRVNQHAEKICDAGFKLIPLQHMRRSGTHPLREIALLIELCYIYRTEKPDLVHHVGLKPVLYGSIISRLLKVQGIINALAGLGYVFSSNRLFAKILRPFVKFVFSQLLNTENTRIIVQNNRDFDVLTKDVGISKDNVRLIRGSGVDIKNYSQNPPTVHPPLVVLIARMLWDKGVNDFVKAATHIRNNGIPARFALVGMPDQENPTSVSENQLREWHKTGYVEWWGYRSDISTVLEMASISCLPTFYGEGVPKGLIESMASCRPIVTTDIPGCRELVDNGRNGILVAPHDLAALIEAVKTLIQDPELCKKMGSAGRNMVEQSLSLTDVIEKTLWIYDDLI